MRPRESAAVTVPPPIPRTLGLMIGKPGATDHDADVGTPGNRVYLLRTDVVPDVPESATHITVSFCIHRPPDVAVAVRPVIDCAFV